MPRFRPFASRLALPFPACLSPTALLPLAAVLLLAPSARSQPLTLGLATNAGSVVSHWPAADGLLGTADDVVNAGTSSLNSSGPNTSGTYSFNAFDFTGSCIATDPWMPQCMNAITFLDGTVTIDQSIAQNGGGPLITGWNVNGTEPFQGHGPYASSIAAVNGGTYTPATGAFTMNLDFAATLGGAVTDTSAGMQMNGTAFFVNLPAGPSPTGNAYVDNTLVPIATNSGAASVLFLTGTGTVPPANNGSWGQMPVHATLVALGPQGTSVDGRSWGGVKALYR